jgi:hypothetical protein
MPRYYFDLVDDRKIYDRKGISLPNLNAARDYAHTFVRELMEEKKTLLGEPGDAWAILILDGKFQRVMRIPFKDFYTKL